MKPIIYKKQNGGSIISYYVKADIPLEFVLGFIFLALMVSYISVDTYQKRPAPLEKTGVLAIEANIPLDATPTEREEVITRRMAVPRKKLYLIDAAARKIRDIESFEREIKAISERLKVPPSWLMACIHHESLFDPTIENLKGSGATGYIQFMPIAARDMGVPFSTIVNSGEIEQLKYVEKYLQNIRRRYGEFQHPSHLYLGILYPKALSQSTNSYTLFANPSKSYRQNSGMDMNKDGRVTISDIEHKFNKMYPTACLDIKKL